IVLLVAEANADGTANWTAFGNAAYTRPDAELNAAGFTTALKGLPVFGSTEYPDSSILIGNRTVVSYRVGQPMRLRGPFPTYDSSGKLIAADQWYVEEFNGATGDPGHTGKASYVKVV